MDSIQKLEAKVAEFRSSEAARAGRSDVLQSLSLARSERELSYLHRIEDLESRLAKAISSLQALETRIVVDVELLRRDVASLSHGERPAMPEESRWMTGSRPDHNSRPRKCESLEAQAPRDEAVESSDVELIVQDAMRVLSEPTTGPFVVIARPGRQLAHLGGAAPRPLPDSAMFVQIGVQTAIEDQQGVDLAAADSEDKRNKTPKIEVLVDTGAAGGQQFDQDAKSELVVPESRGLCQQCQGHGKLGGGLCFECFGSGKISVDKQISEIDEASQIPDTGLPAVGRKKVSRVVPHVSEASGVVSKMEEPGTLHRLMERVADIERLLEENGIQKPVHAPRKHWWS